MKRRAVSLRQLSLLHYMYYVFAVPFLLKQQQTRLTVQQALPRSATLTPMSQGSSTGFAAACATFSFSA